MYSHAMGLTSHKLEIVLFGGLTPRVPVGGAGGADDCVKEPGIFMGGGYGAGAELL